jgi:hypothetical protein
MHWLVDNAGMVYLALGLVAVGFLAAFRLRGRVLHLGGAAGCLALMGLIWLLTLWIVTDRKQIAANVRAMADAVVRHDAERLFKYIARDFHYQNMDREVLYGKVQQAMKLHRVTDITVSDIEIEELSRPQRQARVNFMTLIEGPDGTRLFRLRTEFTLEVEVWKLRHMQLFNPLVDQDRPIDIPLP